MKTNKLSAFESEIHPYGELAVPSANAAETAATVKTVAKQNAPIMGERILWQDTASYRCRSCRMSKDGFPILQAMQDRKTFMPPTAPPIMNFGTISQGRASRNLSEAAQRENVLKQGN